MTSEMKQAYTLRITQANKTQLIVILYEMLLVYSKDASEFLMQDNKIGFKESIRKARGCINELMASLNFEYEPSDNLLQLYLYVNRELIRCEIKRDAACLDHINIVIGSLQKAYAQVSQLDTSKPVMSNTQTVFAGLTYGKGELNESMADQGAARGFYV